MVLAPHEAKGGRNPICPSGEYGGISSSLALRARRGWREGLRPLLGRIRASRRSPQGFLESIGIEVSMPIAAENFLDGMIEKFGESFPKGADFSAYSASTLESSIGRATPMAAWSLVTNAKSCCSASSSGISWSATSRHTLARRLMLMACCAPLCRPSSAASPVRGRRSRINSMLFDARGIRYSAQKYRGANQLISSSSIDDTTSLCRSTDDASVPRQPS